MSPWTDLTDWWQAELASDPSYEDVVTPLLLEVLRPTDGALYLDLGCGTGRVMATIRELGARPIGVELALGLARLAANHAPTIVDSLPGLGSVRDRSADGAYAVLVIEHLPEISGFFQSVARIVKPGGIFALVMNHPVWTAPKSTPITDDDGEVLWRPGAYFEGHGSSEIESGGKTITFFHRPMADVVNAAGSAGWSLETMVERPHHEFADQSGIPRLMACRWRLIP